MNRISLYIFSIFFIASFGCTKSEDLKIITAEELYPLQVGKTFTYRLDSTVLANFNQQLVVKSYNAKDSIESQFTDAQGRKSFRIFRYIRDTNNIKPWQYTATYNAVFDANRVEFVDNNLRFVTLVSPAKEGTVWKGTLNINTISPSPYSYFADWNFEYRNVGKPYTVKKGTIQNTYTVFQQDEILPNVPFNANNYQEKSYSVEVYAKGVGLIYKDFIRWVYQPPSAVNKFYQEGSYGIRLSLIDNK